MCVIIIKSLGKKLPDGVAKMSSTINPHGLGIIWTDTFEVSYHKSSEYRLLETDRPFIAHFRYATVGKVCISNTHPFKCGKQEDELLMMNGTIKGLGNKQESDSRVLARQLGDVKRSTWKKKLEEHRCRFVTINTKKRTYEVYNKAEWAIVDGIWYSKSNVLQQHIVAVYGTLKSGLSNHRCIGNGTFVGSGKTKDKYPLIVKGLPYLIPTKGIGNNVEVEVYRVGDSVMRDLDALEGHPRFYERVEIPITLDDRTTIKCWVYFSKTQVVEVGDVLEKTFKGHKKTKNKKTPVKLPDWGTDTKVPKEEAFIFESEPEFDVNGELPICVNCFHDLEYDNFSNFYCRSCDEWFGERDVIMFSNIKTHHDA